MGRGVGKVLFQSVVAELMKMGYRNIYLWVLEENLRARRFYEKEGFLGTDDYLYDNIGGKDVHEIRYTLSRKIVCNSLEADKKENQNSGGTGMCGMKAD